MVDKTEKFHTAVDFLPVLELKTEQWPFYDEIVYDEMVWDREYYLNFGFTLALTLEIAHMTYYKLSATFTFLKLGFGVQDIGFEDAGTVCSQFYTDSKLFQTSLLLETNSKPCGYNWFEPWSRHWDSRED